MFHLTGDRTSLFTVASAIATFSQPDCSFAFLASASAANTMLILSPGNRWRHLILISPSAAMASIPCCNAALTSTKFVFSPWKREGLMMMAHLSSSTRTLCDRIELSALADRTAGSLLYILHASRTNCRVGCSGSVALLEELPHRLYLVAESRAPISCLCLSTSSCQKWTMSVSRLRICCFGPVPSLASTKCSSAFLLPTGPRNHVVPLVILRTFCYLHHPQHAERSFEILGSSCYRVMMPRIPLGRQRCFCHLNARKSNLPHLAMDSSKQSDLQYSCLLPLFTKIGQASRTDVPRMLDIISAYITMM